MPLNNAELHDDILYRKTDSQTPIVVQYVDAPAGSGKTHTAIILLDELAANKRQIIYAVPSKALIDEVYGKFKDAREAGEIREYPLFKAHEDTTEEFERVRYIASSWINDTATLEKGGVIVITHSTLMNLIREDLIEAKKDWLLVVDEEIINITGEGFINVATPDVMTRLFDERTFGLNDCDMQANLQPSPKEKDLVKNLSTPNYKSDLQEYRGDDWESLCKGVLDILRQVLCWKTNTNENKHSFNYISYLGPEFLDGFESVIMISADLTNSLLYKLWSTDGVIFKYWAEWFSEHEKHSIRKVPTGKHLTIYYLLRKKKWRSYFLDEVTKLQKRSSRNDVVKRILDKLMVNLLSENIKLGGRVKTVQPLLRVNNAVNDFLTEKLQDNRETTLDRYIPLSGNPAGLNHYSNEHKLVYLQTNMPLPKSMPWIMKKGNMTEPEVRDAWYHVNMYQTVLRCSLRNPDDISPKVVVVGDSGSAEYLSRKLPGAKLVHHSIDILEELISSKEENRKIRSDNGTGLGASKESMRKVRGWFKKFDIKLSDEHGSEMFKNKHERNLASYVKDLHNIYDIDLTNEAIKEYQKMDADLNIEGKGRKTAAKNMRKVILSLETSE